MGGRVAPTTAYAIGVQENGDAVIDIKLPGGGDGGSSGGSRSAGSWRGGGAAAAAGRAARFMNSAARRAGSQAPNAVGLCLMGRLPDADFLVFQLHGRPGSRITSHAVRRHAIIGWRSRWAKCGAARPRTI